MYDSRTRLVGDGLPDSTRVYQVKVVTAMLKAGVPLSKVDLFRDLLEEHGNALTSSTNLRQLIPFIHQEELSRIKQEILNQPLSIIFDRTTHVCEAFVVVLRYFTDDWELKQCVRQLNLLAKTMTGEEIAQQIIVILSTEFGISSNLIVATVRDRASVNDVAMRTIKVVYNELLDVGCFSHFMTSATGLSAPSYSSTRWWSQFKVIHSMLKTFSDVKKSWKAMISLQLLLPSFCKSSMTQQKLES